MTFVTHRITDDGASTVAGPLAAVTGAGGQPAAAWSDNSDATYASGFQTDGNTNHNYIEVADGGPDFPDDIAIVSLAIRVRLAAIGGSGVVYVRSSLAGGSDIPVNVTWSSPTTVTVWTGLPTNFSSNFRAASQSSSGGGASLNTRVRIYELFLDWTYALKPAVDVTAPTGTIEDTNRPEVTWTDTLDSDGGAQTRTHVRIFSAAQYGAGGFDPATSPATATLDAATSATGWTPPVLANGTYRAYTRVAQTVAGDLHWSDWDYAAFVVDVDVPDAPTVTLTPRRGAGFVRIDMLGDSVPSTDRFEIERSTDAGATWTPIRTLLGDGIVAGVSDDATAFDVDAPTSTPLLYRVRGLHEYSGVYAAGAWTTEPTELTASGWWIGSPLRALAVELAPYSVPSTQRAARQGTFQPLGAANAIVVSDTRAARSGEAIFIVETPQARSAFDELLDLGEPLLLRAPAADGWADRWVIFGDLDSARRVDKSWVHATLDTLPWVEVDPPAGNLPAWPDDVPDGS